MMCSHPKLPVEHYDAAYFASHSQHGKLAARANRFKFAQYINTDDRLIDFGCGGGYLLREFGNKECIGVEISEHALRQVRSFGITAVRSLDEIDDEWADVVISNHALEHVESPFLVLDLMRRKLKPGGRLVIVVPCDSVRYSYRADDPDYHLYSWSPSNLGNLARAAGFGVLEVKEIVHKWPPKWYVLQRHLGWNAFHFCSVIWGVLSRSRTQVRVVAKRIG